jgi:uncharacterized membrane protein
MGLQQYKTLLLVVTVVSALFVATPAIQQLVVLPQTEYFTELSLLGPYHNATYPYNVSAGDNYRLYLDIGNHLGSCAYYLIQVEFRNQTQSAPDSFNHANSNQPSLGNISFFVADKETLELPINISFRYKVDASNTDQLDMQNIILNGAVLNANTTTIAWDTERKGFNGNLFFELWIFNDTVNFFQYHQRYVSLWLKMNT